MAEKLIYVDKGELSEPIALAGWESAEVVLLNDGGAALVLRNGDDHEQAMAEGVLVSDL